MSSSLNPNITVELKRDPIWSFGSEHPRIWVNPEGSYGRSYDVDPHPCYNHDVERVDELMSRVYKAFPLGGRPLHVYVLGMETLDRANGWYQSNWQYDNTDKLSRLQRWYPMIALVGKRIPLHPAMTRYLCGHEYGHAVEAYLQSQEHFCDLKETHDECGARCYLKWYMEKVRGMKYEVPDAYGGRTWHEHPGEIFANDFRICVPKLEAEFWPHNCQHPLELDAVQNFWKEKVKWAKGVNRGSRGKKTGIQAKA